MTTISQHVLLCPECGMPPKQVQTQYGLRSSCCSLWSWDSKPLVDAATHDARQRAHAVFDEVWQSGRMKRREAYRRLAEAMGMSGKECHISLMDAATAQRVPEAVKMITPPTENQDDA